MTRRRRQMTAWKVFGFQRTYRGHSIWIEDEGIGRVRWRGSTDLSEDEVPEIHAPSARIAKRRIERAIDRYLGAPKIRDRIRFIP